MKNITIATSNDWQGVYINGTLRAENHSLRLSDLLTALDAPWKDLFITDDEWMENMGHLPENLSDIPKDKLK